ncbi:hypothetical protein PAXRUDRAFT_827251 [Paxillus rubicundulus Ve08.2h10]|uniref:Uncharacterized protein n=1 Tax=Paxillus rubicundulus Ve08.2h10 TaxID=930991 RepID=A0A0D0E8S7_9AGAM|nr:hypothetical protein PAXRUDRAFT_827251 [Paxillus rubicundulus Ve08.2h10]
MDNHDQTTQESVSYLQEYFVGDIITSPFSCVRIRDVPVEGNCRRGSKGICETHLTTGGSESKSDWNHERRPQRSQPGPTESQQTIREHEMDRIQRPARKLH